MVRLTVADLEDDGVPDAQVIEQRRHALHAQVVLAGWPGALPQLHQLVLLTDVVAPHVDAALPPLVLGVDLVLDVDLVERLDVSPRPGMSRRLSMTSGSTCSVR